MTAKNSNKPSAAFSDPAAVPSSHLKNLNPNVRQYFTLKESDINNYINSYWTNKGTSLGYTGTTLTNYVNEHKNLIVADVLYASSVVILRSLLSIRPFKSHWYHSATKSDYSISQNF